MIDEPERAAKPDCGATTLSAMSGKKARELALVGCLLDHLRFSPESVEPIESGGDALVTLASGKVSVEVTELYEVTGRDSPQARAARWEGLRAFLNALLREAGLKGELLLDFHLDGQSRVIPPTKDFAAFATHLLAEISSWSGEAPATVMVSSLSPLSPWLEAIDLNPSEVVDVTSNHIATFLWQLGDASIEDVIRRKVDKKGTDVERWLLVVCGATLHQPIAGLGEVPPDLNLEPDPAGVFRRIYSLDLLSSRLFEKSGRGWTELMKETRENA